MVATPRNVVLIGTMGAGKTTVGRILATRLGFRFFDTDAIVAEEAGESIPSIWRREGEQGFRDREHDAVVRACAGVGRVIACGGGAVLRIVNYGLLKGAGPIVYLRAPVETLWSRAGRDPERPLASDEDGFARLTATRAPAYETAADHIVDVDERTPEQVAIAIEEVVA